MQHNQILAYFAHQIESELGIVYADHNYFQLQNRLDEIAKLLDVGSLETLYETAKQGWTSPIKQLLMDLATNNETSFFRDPKIFKSVESTILPWFLETYAGKKMLIWSAASSSGQEALSTAMTISEWNEKLSQKIDFHISATDISERILKKAQDAVYSQLEVQRGLPANLMIKYFKKNANDNWQAIEKIREKMNFRKLNLKDIFSFENPFHLVLCRNVLIYQSIEGKKDILQRIHSKMAPGGFLILGAGESLIGLSNDFTQVHSEGAVIYQKK